MATYKSKRGLDLLWTGDALKLERPIITMESYCKWYGLHIIKPSTEPRMIGCDIEEVPFPDIGEGTPYADHAPNPKVVLKWAKQMNYDICDLSLEMMIGRWALEYEDKFNEELE